MLGGPDAYPTPHDWKRDDQKRPLTEKGEAQSQVARAWFYGEPMRIIEAQTAIVASGARRATETAHIMLGSVQSLSILLCPGLHPAGIAPAMEAMFTSIGYGPIDKYTTTAEGAKAVEEYAQIVASELTSLILGQAGQDTVAIFGHAVFLNAVALYLVGGVPGQAAPAGVPWVKLAEEDVDRLLKTDLGEAEGLLFEHSPDGGSFTHMRAR